MDFSKVATPEKGNFLIAFIDIQNFLVISKALPDPVQLFELLNSWANVIIKEIDKTPGRVLKFIGDACLIIFPDDSVDLGVLSLLSIKDQAEKHVGSRNYGVCFPDILAVSLFASNPLSSSR